MKIIFALFPEKGHINPFIGPAQALQDLGHSVSVVSIGDISAQIEAAGLQFHSDLLAHLAGILPPPPHGKAFVELMKDKRSQQVVIEQVFIDGASRLVPLFENFYVDHQPDLLVLDPMNYGAIIAAERTGIPWVGMSSSLSSVLPEGLTSDVLQMLEILEPKRKALFERFDVSVRFRAIDALSPRLNITFATQEFIGTPPPEISLVGPSRPLRERGDESEEIPFETDRPVVYVSFGSQIFYFPEVFEKVLEAAHEAEAFAVLSIGDLIDEPQWQAPPAHALFYRYAPQRKLLKQVDLFITHGGANSIAESLVEGVPVLVSPVCNDQAHQAHFVEQSGVGRVLDLQTASVSEIKAAILEMIGDARIQGRVQEVSASYQLNGVIRAAHLISEQMGGDRRSAGPRVFRELERPRSCS